MATARRRTHRRRPRRSRSRIVAQPHCAAPGAARPVRAHAPDHQRSPDHPWDRAASRPVDRRAGARPVDAAVACRAGTGDAPGVSGARGVRDRHEPGDRCDGRRTRAPLARGAARLAGAGARPGARQVAGRGGRRKRRRRPDARDGPRGADTDRIRALHVPVDLPWGHSARC